LCLTQLRYSTNKNDLLNDSEISSKLQKDLSSWNLDEIMVAAIFCKYQGELLNFADWTRFISILLNPSVSDSLFSLLKQNQFNEVQQKKEVLFGAQYLFQYNAVLLEEKCLKNFFDFLRIDDKTSNSLISSTLLKNDVIDILNFLKNEDSILLTLSEKRKRKTKLILENLENFLLKNGIKYYWLFILLDVLAMIFSPRRNLFSIKLRKDIFEPGAAPFSYLTDS